jgi:serine/threonine protein kinase
LLKLQAVTLLKEIGSGSFGAVWKGMLNESRSRGTPEYQVAVKTVLEADKSTGAAEELLTEAMVMAQLQGHTNVVSIIGVVTSGNPYMLVLSFCEHGCMSSYLRSCATKGHPVGGFAKLELATQTAMGMEHLISRRYIHRDLAARNVLLAAGVSQSGLVAKVADFGLSRSGRAASTTAFDASNDGNDGSEEDFYESKMGVFPVRWTAPEAMETLVFNQASDVWSFGIVMVEIANNGAKPYKSIRKKCEVARYVLAGNVHPKPASCPEPLFTIMVQCWHPEALNRPTFSELVQALETARVNGHFFLDGGATVHAASIGSVSSASHSSSSSQSLHGGQYPPRDSLDLPSSELLPGAERPANASGGACGAGLTPSDGEERDQQRAPGLRRMGPLSLDHADGWEHGSNPVGPYSVELIATGPMNERALAVARCLSGIKLGSSTENLLDVGDNEEDCSNERASREEESSNDHSGCDLSFDDGPFRVQPLVSAELRTGYGELACSSGDMDDVTCPRKISDVSEGAYFVQPASQFNSSLESRPLDERNESTDESPYRAGDSALAALLTRSRGAGFADVSGPHPVKQTSNDDAVAVDDWVDTDPDDDMPPGTPPRLREDVAALLSAVSSVTHRKGYESPLPPSIWQTCEQLKPKTVKRKKTRKMQRFLSRSAPTRDGPSKGSKGAPSSDHMTLLIDSDSVDSDSVGVFSI